jgi:hypothetical protein
MLFGDVLQSEVTFGAQLGLHFDMSWMDPDGFRALGPELGLVFRGRSQSSFELGQSGFEQF